MKKTVALIFIFTTLLIILPRSVFAAENENALDNMYSEGLDALDDNLPNSIKSCIDKDELSKEGGVFTAFGKLISELPSMVKEQISLPLTLLGSVTAILLLNVLLGTARNIGTNQGMSLIVNLATSVTLSLAVSKTVVTLLDGSSSVVSLAEDSVKGIVPVFAGLMAASGSVTSATIFGFSVGAVSSAAASLISDFVTPLTGVIVGIGLVASFYENGLFSLSEGIKKTVVWVLGIMSSLFITALSLQKSVSASTDILLLKTARFFAVSAVPIIGSSVSEAASTVATSIRVIRGSLGSASIIALLVIFLPQIIVNMLCSLSLSVGCIFGDVIGLTEPQKCIKTIKSAIDILTATLVFYLVSITICVAIMINIGA